MVLAWLAVIAPAALRARRATPLNSAERFRQGLEVIAPPPPTAAGRRVYVPRRGPVARRSRRDVQRLRLRALLGLAAATVASVALAVLLGGLWWYAAPGCGLALGLYVAALRASCRARQERLSKIRPLPRAEARSGARRRAVVGR